MSTAEENAVFVDESNARCVLLIENINSISNLIQSADVQYADMKNIIDNRAEGMQIIQHAVEVCHAARATAIEAERLRDICIKNCGARSRADAELVNAQKVLEHETVAAEYKISRLIPSIVLLHQVTS